MRLKSGLHASNRKGSWISKKIKSKQKDKKERQLLKLLPLDEGEESHILVFCFFLIVIDYFRNLIFNTNLQILGWSEFSRHIETTGKNR